jgi:phospholipid/cholesterol/gamma-HCH transport system ATP-binding protein
MDALPANGGGVSLEVRGLRKSIKGHEILRGIELSVGRSEVFVIMGPSGSGKTMLLKHIIGLERPDAGEILVEGSSIQAPETRSKYRLAMVFQSAALLNSLTVAENVGLYLVEHRLKPPAEIARIVSEKLELVGLSGTEDLMPSELSGGMQKRVAIARALVIEPQLILYDEPTGELDPLRAVSIGKEILAMRRRTQVTSLVVTHDRDLALGVADRLAIINEGKILFVGPPDEVRRQPDPIIQEFLTIDFKPNNNKELS